MPGPEELPIVHITDHADEAVRRLPARFQGATRFKAVVRGLADGVQAVEDETYLLIADRLLRTCSGVVLDHYGAIVGEARNGLTDGDYRRFIEARMMANRCRGTPDELIAIWELATEAEATRYVEFLPNVIWLEAERRTPLDTATVRRVLRLMNDARPASKILRLVEVMAATWFGWDDDPASLGYDDGEFSRILE